MAETLTVRLGGPDAALRVAERLRDPKPVLTSIGAVVVAQARKAFEEQRLGDVVWPERYPRQREPFLNIAPVVEKAGEGRTPTADDFRRRPALGGVGSDLAQSIAAQVSGNAVEVGSTRPKAGLFQFGGLGTIAITDTTRATLARWLGISSASGTAAGRRRRAGKFTTQGTGLEYAKKLVFVFDPNRSQMTQGAHPRPFVAFTEQTFADVLGELRGWVEAAA